MRVRRGVISSAGATRTIISSNAMSDTANLFLLAGIWSLISLVLVRFIPNRPARIVMFVLLVGVPFWELPYGYLNFQKLCRDEGKLRVFEPITPQKSVCVAYPFDTSAVELLRYGFATVEAKSKTGEVTRFVGPASSTSSPNKLGTVSSDYCVTFANNIRQPWRVNRHDFIIFRSRDEAVVARHSVFDWNGTWWQEAASPVLGRGGECREDPVKPVVTSLLVGST